METAMLNITKRVEEYMGGVSNALGRERYMNERERRAIEHALNGIALDVLAAAIATCPKYGCHLCGGNIQRDVKIGRG